MVLLVCSKILLDMAMRVIQPAILTPLLMPMVSNGEIRLGVIGRSLVLKLSVVSTNQLGNILVAIFGLSNTMIIGHMCVKKVMQQLDHQPICKLNLILCKILTMIQLQVILSELQNLRVLFSC